MIHISLGGVITIHAEGAWAYGHSPLCRIVRFGREYIVDVPFCRVIVTPALLTLRKSNAGQLNTDRNHFFNRAGRNRDNTENPLGIDQPHAGTATDRP